jgi:hypothetical protein
MTPFEIAACQLIKRLAEYTKSIEHHFYTEEIRGLNIALKEAQALMPEEPPDTDDVVIG